MTAKNVKFMHLEIVHPDPDSAVIFLQEALGVASSNELIEKRIETLYRSTCRHVIFGGLEYRFIQPGALPVDAR